MTVTTDYPTILIAPVKDGFMIEVTGQYYYQENNGKTYIDTKHWHRFSKSITGAQRIIRREIMDYKKPERPKKKFTPDPS